MTHAALVTGASRGIGAAIARRLGREGVFVALAARRRDGCAALAGEIRGDGGRAEALALDVRDPRSIAEAVADARRAAGGPIDWLVNNAGIAVSAPLLPRPGRDAAEGGDLYEEHLAVNFHGPRRLVEALGPEMVAAGYGRIANVVSSAGLRGYAYVAAYVASKHALLGYTLSAAQELAGTGVAINAVCPHYVDSPMTTEAVRRIVRKTGKDEALVRDFFAAQNPGGRLVTPEEVAEVVWELCSGDASGRAIELDGSGTVGSGARVARDALADEEARA